MGNFSLPFSFSDILERVIPGLLVLGSAYYLLTPGWGVENFGALIPIISFVTLISAYSVGVIINSVPSEKFILGYRGYGSSKGSDETECAIRSAVEKTYKIRFTNDSWRLCYGTCVKNGLSANVHLFLGLEIFCRSMMVASAFFSASLILAMMFGSQNPHINNQPACVLFFALGVAQVCAGAFYLGARKYSRVFVSAIYQGFYSWYCERNWLQQTELPGADLANNQIK